MASKLQSYDPKYDWVLVESQRKHSIDRRKWNNQTNMLIAEGEEVLLPRGSSDPDEDLSGMKYYFKNGFYEVVDSEPDVPGVTDAGDEPEPESESEPEPEPEPEEQEEQGEGQESEEEPEPEDEAEEEQEDEESEDEDLSYEELQQWASERDDVAGNQPYDELLEAYREAEE